MSEFNMYVYRIPPDSVTGDALGLKPELLTTCSVSRDSIGAARAALEYTVKGRSDPHGTRYLAVSEVNGKVAATGRVVRSVEIDGD